MNLEVPKHVTSTFEPQKLGPLVQKFKIAQLRFHVFLKNCPTCANHNSHNICHMKVILDFLENSRCPYNLHVDHFFI